MGFIDEIDSKILSIIHKLNKASIAEISNELYLTCDAIRRRVNRLKKDGILILEKIATGKPTPPNHVFSLSPQVDFKMLQEKLIKQKEELEDLSTLTILFLYLLVSLKQGTVSLFAEIVGLELNSVRYYLDKLVTINLADTKNRIDNPKYVIYFDNSNLDLNKLQLIIDNRDINKKELAIYEKINDCDKRSLKEKIQDLTKMQKQTLSFFCINQIREATTNDIRSFFDRKNHITNGHVERLRKLFVLDRENSGRKGSGKEYIYFLRPEISIQEISKILNIDGLEQSNIDCEVREKDIVMPNSSVEESKIHSDYHHQETSDLEQKIQFSEKTVKPEKEEPASLKLNSEAYVVRQMSKDNELIIAQEKKQSIHLFVEQIKRFKELKTEILELETKLLESKTELLELEKALISQGGEYTKTILAGISKVDS